MLKENIGFIGGGNMAEAMIGAVLRAGVSRGSQIYASDVSQERLLYLEKTYGVITTADNSQVLNECGVVVLAVKPQIMEAVLAGLTESQAHLQLKSRKLIISIAAGITLAKLENSLYAGAKQAAMENLPLIRVMPNTPALVLTGMCGMSVNQQVTAADKKIARTVLEATGQVLEFEEADLDAVTAVSGSGPAYVFYLAEAMIEAGVSQGLSPAAAAQLVTQTIKGAATLLEMRDVSAAVLRQQVTSPGGTTEAALGVMEKNEVKRHIMAAIAAAAERARELS